MKTLKEFVEDFGVLILPYKKNINDSYEEIRFFRRQNKGDYLIIGIGKTFITPNFDEAYKVFERYLDNLGVRQSKVLVEHPEWDWNRDQAAIRNELLEQAHN